MPSPIYILHLLHCPQSCPVFSKSFLRNFFAVESSKTPFCSVWISVVLRSLADLCWPMDLLFCTLPHLYMPFWCWIPALILILSAGGAICSLGTEPRMVGSRTLNQALDAKQYNAIQFPELKLSTCLMNHSIIESFGLEGTPRGHLVQSPCSKQGHH